jgi:DMSO reductase anchor subunit
MNGKIVFTLLAAAVGSTPLLAWIGRHTEDNGAVQIAKRFLLIVLLLLCIINVVSGTYSPFIYFRF